MGHGPRRLRVAGLAAAPRLTARPRTRRRMISVERRATLERMRVVRASVLLAGISMIAIAGCSSSTPAPAPTSSNLPYKPEVPVAGPPISAAYTVVSDHLRVEIDTGGRRLERAQIVKADGAFVDAQTIEYTTPTGGGNWGSPVGISIGVGSFGRMGGGGGVGTGVGVSTGGVVGGSGVPAGANSIAAFPLEQAGARPWRVRVKIEGIEPADIVVGSP